MKILISLCDSNWLVEIVSWLTKSLTPFLDLVKKDMFNHHHIGLVTPFRMTSCLLKLLPSRMDIPNPLISSLNLFSISIISYSINARATSNEVVSFDDLFILYCLVEDENIALGRFLQWRLWLISDSLVGTICISGVVTKIAQFYKIDLHSLPSLKFMLFYETFIINSK